MSEGDGFDAATVMSDGFKLRGIDWVFEDEPDDNPAGDDGGGHVVRAADPAERQRRADTIRGMLWSASSLIVDHAFEDLDTLTGGGSTGDTYIYSQLPERFGPYSAQFATRFLVALVDVTVRLANRWAPPPTIAHELALRVILNQAEVVVDLAQLDLPPHWRSALEEELFEDLDHEFLYGGRGIEATIHHASTQGEMGKDSWFHPFDYDNMPAPYSTVIPDSSR